MKMSKLLKIFHTVSTIQLKITNYARKQSQMTENSNYQTIKCHAQKIQTLEV